MTRHGKAAGRRRQWTTQTEDRAQVYRTSFPEKGGPRRCPLEGCLGKLATGTAMRVHFVYRHVLNTVVMLEEGNSPHPRCARCGMQVPFEGAEWAPPEDRAVCERGGEKETAAG